jgi:ferritin-like metal-binding protein YciE
MQTAQELFRHELSDILDAEHRILEALSDQSEESSSPTLQNAFKSHYKQTQGQIQRLEQCFQLIHEEAEQTECAGIKGLLEEHDSMIEAEPSPDILDVFNVAAAIKVERYEISSYESLIRLAELMEQTKVVRLLKQNLKEEEQTLKKMTAQARSVKPQTVNSEGFESGAQESKSQPGPHIVKKAGPGKSRAA